jgi:tight adherence protein C
MDLLRVCVQAGLGLDAAIERVGREMRLASPILSDEWRLTGLELRAGASRAQALRHMAERVGLPEIDAMVTMLIQADRFGTRMADALQVHADALRSQRRLRAEEAAAKLPVKLLFPLVFCIFPALLTVMLGPVAISLYRHLSAPG